MEQLIHARPPEAIFDDTMRHKTVLVDLFVPSDAREQKAAFLADEVTNPVHTYDKLMGVDFDARNAALSQLLNEVSDHPTIPEKYKAVYEDYVAEHYMRSQLAQAAACLHDPAKTEAEKQTARIEFMRLNVKLFGEPTRNDYESAVHETKNLIHSKNLSDQASQIGAELLAMLPETTTASEPYEPSQATKDWVTRLADVLYGGMLKHVPKHRETFTPVAVAGVFRNIIRAEFGESAADWRVILAPVASVNVVAADKHFLVPINRKLMKNAELRGLVGHEPGIHVLRSIMGEQTDLPPLRTGVWGAADSEEGLAMIMQQAVQGKYTIPSDTYPLISGLMYYDNKDFRGCFEIMWRRKLLQDITDSSIIEAQAITEAREWAYKAVMRITRGTDTLPWFKDLSYYNGQVAMWRHLEQICGDDVRFTHLLLGKADASQKKHERVLYETRTP